MKNAPHTTQGMWSPELPKGARYPDVEIQSLVHGKYILEGRILGPDTSPNTILIHGARADYSKADKIICPLADLGSTILTATVSGHGSKGHKSQHGFSLDDNLQEALAFYPLLRGNSKTIIGQSMGGTTAIRMIQSLPEDTFANLVLFYPAVFPDEVYSIPFGTDEFRNIASRKHAFLASSFFDTVKNFRGRILLIKGEFDGLSPEEFGKPDENSVYTTQVGDREVYSPIPPEVFSHIRELRPDTEFIEVPGADHQFAKWYATRPEDARKLAEEIFRFISVSG